MYTSNYLKTKNNILKKNKLSKEFCLEHFSFLKNHKSTRLMNSSPHIEKIFSFFIEKQNYKEVVNCSIYSITNKCLDDLEKQAEIKSKDFKDDEKKLYLDTAKSYKSSLAFYAIGQSEVYYITDVSDRIGSRIRKPARFTISEWRKINLRATIVHELYHFCFEQLTNSKNEMHHESQAYTGMIEWCRDMEGLLDVEIAKYVINTYGQRLAFSKNRSLDMSSRKDREYIDRIGYEEGMRLIQQYDAKTSTNSNQPIKTQFDLENLEI